MKMYSTCFMAYRVFILISTCLSHAIAEELYQTPLASNFELRNATSTDAEAITQIMMAAFDPAPHMKYTYQFKDQYPQEHHDCLYPEVAQILEVPTVLVQVVLMPNVSSPVNMTAIAIAGWALPKFLGFAQEALFSPLRMAMTGKCKHHDLNVTRAIDFDHQFTTCRQKYLDDVYMRTDQLYLAILGTHPDYQRHGAGAALVRSGIEYGRSLYAEENVTATLIATEVGEPLYSYLGWDSLKNFSVKSLEEVDGRREEWKFDVMKYEL